MYAVIETGGKQYRVSEGDVFYVEKVEGAKQDSVVFDRVLLVGGEGADLQLGAPVIEGAKVACEVIEQFRGKKIIVFKVKRRKKYRRRQGHRQSYTRLRVVEISLDGQFKKASATSKPAKIEAPQVAPDEAVGFAWWRPECDKTMYVVVSR